MRIKGKNKNDLFLELNCKNKIQYLFVGFDRAYPCCLIFRVYEKRVVVTRAVLMSFSSFSF